MRVGGADGMIGVASRISGHADGDRADGGEDLLPYSVGAADMRQTKHEVVAGEGRWRREGECDDETDGRRARH